MDAVAIGEGIMLAAVAALCVVQHVASAKALSEENDMKERWRASSESWRAKVDELRETHKLATESYSKRICEQREKIAAQERIIESREMECSALRNAYKTCLMVAEHPSREWFVDRHQDAELPDSGFYRVYRYACHMRVPMFEVTAREFPFRAAEGEAESRRRAYELMEALNAPL